MLDYLLPIGSVVTLEEGKHKLMIFGVKQTHSETGKLYDYAGVLYPEGNVGTEYLITIRLKAQNFVVMRTKKEKDL